MSVTGGMQVGRDGRIHTHFGHNPSSLRLCSFDPNLQNIPRGGTAYERYVKEIFVAPPGGVFWERDYSAIEAVLVGYFAGSPKYIRAAKMGVHDFFSAARLGRPADLAWPDDKLRSYLAAIKAETDPTGQRDVSKRCVHGGNYLMTPKMMAMTYPEDFPTVGAAARVLGEYFDIFPEIRAWHKHLTEQVDGTKKRRRGDGPELLDPWTLGVCHAVNPFGYTHRFYNVLDWELILHDGTKEWVSSFGEDAKRLVSFLPQSTAAAILKRAAKDLYYSYPWVGETLRLLIHDSILGEAAEKELEVCLTVSQQVMEAPIPELPLDPTWGLGSCLSIGTEAKVGTSWGNMKKVN